MRSTGHVYYPDKAGKLKRWKAAIRHGIPIGTTFGKSILAVDLVFVIKRPLGHWSLRGFLTSTAAAHPIPPFDLDNYAKCVIDELCEAGVLVDDRSIVDLRVRKEWQARHLSPSGCEVTVRRVLGTP